MHTALYVEPSTQAENISSATMPTEQFTQQTNALSFDERNNATNALGRKITDTLVLVTLTSTASSSTMNSLINVTSLKNATAAATAATTTTTATSISKVTDTNTFVKSTCQGQD